MRLTKRDIEIILAVHQFRMLSSPQIEAMFFPSPRPNGCRTSCQRRLQLLYHHGYLTRLFQPVVLGEGRAPIVYALAEKGADLVASSVGVDRAGLNWHPKKNAVGFDFVSHQLAINDFRIIVKLACGQTPLVLKQWISDAEFRTAAMKNRVPVRNRGARIVRNYPDGYFRVAVPDVTQDAHFFLEVDQGTMSHTRWKEKINAYSEFRDRGLSQQHYGTGRFRLLTVTSSARRLKGLKGATEKAGGDHHFWFATRTAVDIWQPIKLLDPVWSVATRKGQMPLFPRSLHRLSRSHSVSLTAK